MAREISGVLKKMAKITTNRRDFQLVESREEIARPSRRGRETHSFVVEENVIGRNEDRDTILKMLLEDVVEERVRFIPIFGMGGIGKTTLVQLVFNHREVEKHFNLKSWICVSDDFDTKTVIGKLVSTITGASTEHMEMETTRMKLHEEISEKRFLFVLDDVWDEDHQQWQKLKELLTTRGKPGSRIVVTTRSKKVARLASNKQQYPLGILGEDASWFLFKKLAFEQRQELTETNIEDIGKQIAKKCRGIPLAIKMIASMLSYRDPITEWPSFLSKELSSIPQQEDSILPTLKLSYDCLPSHLKPCFAYCRLFPKDYNFDVETLVTLWISQGFISESSDRSRSLEDEGYDHFLELAWRSFFQEIEIEETTNKVVRCKMHDFVHDLAILVAGEKYANIDPRSQPNTLEKVIHLSIGLRNVEPSLVLQAKMLHSIILTYKGRFSVFEDIVQECLKFRFLRALDLHGINMKDVPISIGELKHLRYLDLSSNDIRRLPTSITRLVNLQTLKLEDCYSLQELPRGIHKLVNLRHLTWSISTLSLPNGVKQLTNIQTLSYFTLSEDPAHCKLEELTELNNLRGELHIRELRHEMEIKDAVLSGKGHLRSLHLQWKSTYHNGASTRIDSEPEKMLEKLQPHRNLRVLIVERYGGVRLSNWFSSLTNLVELRLLHCSRVRHLTSLDALHLLKRLHLDSCLDLEYIVTVTDIYRDDHNESTKEFSRALLVFPSLTALFLKNLPNFKGWKSSNVTENEHQGVELLPYYFPCLTNLSIFECPKLTSLLLYPNMKTLGLSGVSKDSFERTISMNITRPQISVATKNKISSSLTSTPFYPLSQVRFLRLISYSSKSVVQHFPSWTQSLSSLKELHISRLSELLQSMQFKDGYLDWEVEEGDRCEMPIRGSQEATRETFSRIERLILERVPVFKYLSLAARCFTSLRSLRIQGYEEVALDSNGSDDTIEWEAFTSLRELTLYRLKNLVALPEWLQQITTLQELKIWSCDNLSAIPDWICNFSSLQQLLIWDCHSLESLPASFGRLTSLESLSIKGCPVSFYSSDGSDCGRGFRWDSLVSLHTLVFSRVQTLVTLPEGIQFAPTLQLLCLISCDNLTTIPNWICNMPSLQQLEIESCPKIESLPGSIPGLTSFAIYGCPILEKRCHPRTGEDWPKIQDIPVIRIHLMNPKVL